MEIRHIKLDLLHNYLLKWRYIGTAAFYKNIFTKYASTVIKLKSW